MTPNENLSPSLTQVGFATPRVEADKLPQIITPVSRSFVRGQILSPEDYIRNIGRSKQK